MIEYYDKDELLFIFKKEKKMQNDVENDTMAMNMLNSIMSKMTDDIKLNLINHMTAGKNVPIIIRHDSDLYNVSMVDYDKDANTIIIETGQEIPVKINPELIPEDERKMLLLLAMLLANIQEYYFGMPFNLKKSTMPMKPKKKFMKANCDIRVRKCAKILDVLRCVGSIEVNKMKLYILDELLSKYFSGFYTADILNEFDYDLEAVSGYDIENDGKRIWPKEHKKYIIREK